MRGLNVDRPLRLDLERLGVRASGTHPTPNCFVDNCSNRKRDGSILMQQNARDELKVLSQARNARHLAELPGYAYDARGGRGITVYLIDTGINPNHPVSVTDSSIVNKAHSFPGIQKYSREHPLALSTR